MSWKSSFPVTRRAAVAVLIGLLVLTAVAVSTVRAAIGHRSAASAYAFSPYVDLTGWPVPRLTAIRHGSGARELTLAFVTAKGNTSCTPTWGGYASYPAAGSHAYQLAQVRSFRRAGGSVVASFGGESGAELATVCPSISALQTAYAGVLAAYRANRLDFDIEGSDVTDLAAARRRAGALAALQRAAARRGRNVHISLTLPTLPSGLTAAAERIVRITVAAGVRMSLVNGMAMDYGDSAAPHPAGRMGAYAIDVARHMQTQLAAILPHLGRRAIARLVGITPMIGINDVSDEVFTLADARQLARYARRSGLGELSMWQAERDRACPHRVTSAQDDCSGVSQAPWAFSRLLGP